MESYDEKSIADLWTEDATWVYLFRIRPRGRAAITAEWLAEKAVFDGRGYEAAYEPIAIDGPFVATHGRTRFYDVGTGETQAEFDNVWVLRFGPDGRCAEFHEWYAGRPEHDPSRAARLPMAHGEASIHIDRPPEEVFRVVGDPANNPTWARTSSGRNGSTMAD